MRSRDEIERALAPFLAHHRELGVEFGPSGMSVLLHKVRTNLLGNFGGGDVAYAANAAAALLCVAEGRLSETASLHLECLERADGDELVARATTIKSGRKLIRLRVDVFVRADTRETLVGIAQVSMSPARSNASSLGLPRIEP